MFLPAPRNSYDFPVDVQDSLALYDFSFYTRVDDDERVYGDSQTEPEGTIAFDVPENAKALFFVVAGTSDKYVPHPWDATELNDPQAPYAIRVAYE